MSNVGLFWYTRRQLTRARILIWCKTCAEERSVPEGTVQCPVCGASPCEEL